MAFINCPESGKENVSHCGYGIKAHYVLLKKEEEKEKEQSNKA